MQLNLKQNKHEVSRFAFREVFDGSSPQASRSFMCKTWYTAQQKGNTLYLVSLWGFFRTKLNSGTDTRSSL